MILGDNVSEETVCKALFLTWHEVTLFFIGTFFYEHELQIVRKFKSKLRAIRDKTFLKIMNAGLNFFALKITQKGKLKFTNIIYCKVIIPVLALCEVIITDASV